MNGSLLSRYCSASYDSGETTTFGYDALGQLTSESRSGYSASYTYDGNGNRLTRTVNSVTEDYTYDNGDKLEHVKIGGVTQKSYTYDAAGRTKTVVTGAGTTSLTYDFESRITRIDYPNSTYDTYSYNGLDTRISKVENGTSRTFMRDGTSPVAPVLTDGAATYTPGISERRSSTTTYLQHGLKNAELQTTASQTIGATKEFDAFGNLLNSTGTWNGPFGYAGGFGYQDDASGLKLLGHRYYDSSIGRFLTRDPIKDGRNWYVYCDSDPVSFLDYTGHEKIRVPAKPGDLAKKGWERDNKHEIPGKPDAGRWFPPGADHRKDEGLEFHPKTEGAPGWRGKDHWHRVRNGKTNEGDHLEEGDEIVIKTPEEKEMSKFRNRDGKLAGDQRDDYYYLPYPGQWLPFGGRFRGRWVAVPAGQPIYGRTR